MGARKPLCVGVYVQMWANALDAVTIAGVRGAWNYLTRLVADSQLPHFQLRERATAPQNDLRTEHSGARFKATNAPRGKMKGGR